MTGSSVRGMAEKNSSKNNLIAQAGILAAAGIISRIIGLLYRSPMHAVIGDLGMGYYQSAYNYYTIILLISSYSIPSAISKVIAQKLAVKEYRNAHRIFLCALGYVLVVGGVASLFLFFGARLFVSQEAVVPVLRTFAPTIFVYGILGVLRGYFQAHRSMAQTSVSQILEQIANAVVSVGAAYLLIKNAMGGMEVPADEAGRVTRAVNGAIGSALGTGAGVLTALAFMLAVYWLNRDIIQGRIRRDRHREAEPYGRIVRTITGVVTPFILSTAVYNLSGVVNNHLYTERFPAAQGLSSVEIYSRWGVFSNALTISNIPIAFATAMAAAIIPSVAQLAAAKDEEGTRNTIGLAVKVTMLISIPCAVGLFVLARPVTALLFPNTKDAEDLATALLMALAPSVVFYALSTLNSQALQGLGKLNKPIVNAGIALAVQTIAALGLLFLAKLDLYSIAAANTVYAGSMCFLNQRAVRQASGYRQEIKKTFLIPMLASAVMGAAVWAVYEGLLLLTRSPRISVFPAVFLGACVYFVMLLLFRGVSEQDLRELPKGYLLVRAARKMKLLR